MDYHGAVTTVAVVRKGATACIAADSLTSFGEMKLTAEMSVGKRKVLAVGDAFLGLSGSTSHLGVLESHFASLDSPPELRSKSDIFETWRRLHVVLKEHYFLNPKDEATDPYESSQMTALVASPWGIFGIYSLREVFEYKAYWALGSGREYALGALAALYDRLPTAQEIAEEAVRASCTFDNGSSLPLERHVVALRANGRGRPPRRRPGAARNGP